MIQLSQLHYSTHFLIQISPLLTMNFIELQKIMLRSYLYYYFLVLSVKKTWHLKSWVFTCQLIYFDLTVFLLSEWVNLARALPLTCCFLFFKEKNCQSYPDRYAQAWMLSVVVRCGIEYKRPFIIFSPGQGCFYHFLDINSSFLLKICTYQIFISLFCYRFIFLIHLH